MVTPARTNWSGTLGFPGPLHRPASVETLRALLAGAAAAGRRVRPLGSGHSFSPVAAPAPGGEQVSLAAMPVVRDLDRDRALARVSAGLRYGDIAPWLHGCGFALHNLGSLPHISVAGTCATGTHGSGDRLGALATAVRGMRLVTAAGDEVELSPDGAGPGCGEQFAGAALSLGGLGVVTEVTLAVQPAYDVRQSVYTGLTVDALVEHVGEIMASAYSVSVFHSWRDEQVDSVWRKERIETDSGATDQRPEDELFGARRATTPQSIVADGSTASHTDQGSAGPWHTRLPHFRMEFAPSSGAELQTEYLLPREHGPQALRALHEIRAAIAPLLIISEIRTVAADDLWLSGAYGRDVIALHFSWHPDAGRVAAVLPLLEERLLPLAARPHWGKVFAAGPDAVRPLHPRLDDARALLREFDPGGVLSNPFLDAYLRD